MSSEKQSEYEYYLTDSKPFQLVVRSRPRRVVFFRAKPVTAYEPTTPQLMVRVAFGEVARRARGMRFVGILPPAAELVRNYMKGVKFSESSRKPKWLKVLELIVKS